MDQEGAAAATRPLADVEPHAVFVDRISCERAVSGATATPASLPSRGRRMLRP